MDMEPWKQRLVEAIRAKGGTLRSVSLAAGRGPGYVHSLIGEGKNPKIENLARVCDVAGVSVSYVLYGIEMSPETEEILSILAKNPDLRGGILQVLRSAASGGSPSEQNE